MSHTLEEKFEAMVKIRDELLHLTNSPLYSYRIANKYFPVVGEGSHTAKIMFIGEAPGKNEAETGRPFCGKSGKILDEMLESIQLNRSDVYITNILKDRPEDNRDPKPEEIALYSTFLDRQIEIVQPKVIATLGRFSMEYILNLFGLKDKLSTISEMHGQEFISTTNYGPVVIFPLYHPAITSYNGGSKTVLLEDFQKLKKYV
ncbi:MAG: uracil-DNA glycosylase [Candidatus Zambryskibacteria bacterium]|nr:uracil-DNA glycosylase [Candidatus Zambryskibacteria bacterium]